MTYQILRDLRNLRIKIYHAPDDEGHSLVDHLRRIGCKCDAEWPMPAELEASVDVAVISIEQEYHDRILKMLRSRQASPPTVIGVVSYENPSMLQLLLETGTMAVVERPVRPFGLLTNLILARSLWHAKHESHRRIQKLERRLAGSKQVNKAKNVLMTSQGISEAEAHEIIRVQAMAKRISMSDMATAIIHAQDLLPSTSKDV